MRDLTRCDIEHRTSSQGFGIEGEVEDVFFERATEEHDFFEDETLLAHEGGMALRLRLIAQEPSLLDDR